MASEARKHLARPLPVWPPAQPGRGLLLELSRRPPLSTRKPASPATPGPGQMHGDPKRKGCESLGVSEEKMVHQNLQKTTLHSLGLHEADLYTQMSPCRSPRVFPVLSPAAALNCTIPITMPIYSSFPQTDGNVSPGTLTPDECPTQQCFRAGVTQSSIKHIRTKLRRRFYL